MNSPLRGKKEKKRRTSFGGRLHARDDWDCGRITRWNLVCIIPWQLSERRGEKRGEESGVGITGRLFDLALGKKERLFLPQKPLWDFALGEWVSALIRISYLQLEWMQHSIQTTEGLWWGSAFYVPYLLIWLKLILHLPTLYVLLFKWKKENLCMRAMQLNMHGTAVINLCGGKICKFDWFLCFRGKSISLTSLLYSRMFVSFMQWCSKSSLPPILNCCICFTTPCFGVVIEEPWMADKYNSMYRALQAFFFKCHFRGWLLPSTTDASLLQI